MDLDNLVSTLISKRVALLQCWKDALVIEKLQSLVRQAPSVVLICRSGIPAIRQDQIEVDLESGRVTERHCGRLVMGRFSIVYVSMSKVVVSKVSAAALAQVLKSGAIKPWSGLWSTTDVEQPDLMKNVERIRECNSFSEHDTIVPL